MRLLDVDADAGGGGDKLGEDDRGSGDSGDGEVEAVVPTVRGGASLAPLRREANVRGEDGVIT